MKVDKIWQRECVTGCVQGHRGSSPQIRTFTPDGRSSEDVYDFDVPPTNGSPRSTTGGHFLCRSPSPLRAASFDVRCSSPTPLPQVAQPSSELRTPSPSQSSLTSLTERSASPASSVATSRVRKNAFNYHLAFKFSCFTSQLFCVINFNGGSKIIKI